MFLNIVSGMELLCSFFGNGLCPVKCLLDNLAFPEKVARRVRARTDFANPEMFALFPHQGSNQGSFILSTFRVATPHGVQICQAKIGSTFAPMDVFRATNIAPHRSKKACLQILSCDFPEPFGILTQLL